VTDLAVRFSAHGERCVLRLTGELDLETVPELREHAEAELAAGAFQTLSLDLSGLTFIDSSGLGLLVDLRRQASSAGISFELENVPPGPARVIAIAGLAATFGVELDDDPPVG
jgi:anti-anti-sigma factor